MQLTDLPGPSGALTAGCKPTSVSAIIQHQPLSTPAKTLMGTIPGLLGTSWGPGFSQAAETHFFRLIQKDWSGRTLGTRRFTSQDRLADYFLTCPMPPSKSPPPPPGTWILLPTPDWEWELDGVWIPPLMCCIQTTAFYCICRAEPRGQISWFLEQSRSPDVQAHSELHSLPLLFQAAEGVRHTSLCQQLLA